MSITVEAVKAALAQGARARTLRFVPQANLTALDPIWTSAIVTQMHGYHVYDTLYAVDGQQRARPLQRGAGRIDGGHVLRAACERHQGHPHAKTHALAVELLNDWEAIFQVLHHPELPLTNNDAERALRHWVIARKISHGTRTATGSRVFALLASVIDTCRRRGHSPWEYLRTAIARRRQGLALLPLPA